MPSFCAEHVVIRGHVFTFAEKAPFVRSGASVLGAIEYDKVSEKVKCHECGEWRAWLSKHITEHGLSQADYKARHGLNLSTKLCTPEFSKARSGFSRRQPKEIKMAAFAKVTAARDLANKTVDATRAPRQRREKANIEGKCAAQTIWRLQVLAADKQRTPTSEEIKEAALISAIYTNFGSIPAALTVAHLELRTATGASNGKKGGELPEGFPTKKQLDESRMPWPKEYFGVTTDIALRRRAS